MNLSGLSIPLGSVALCLDCDSIFSVDQLRCPKDGTSSWVLIEPFLNRARGDRWAEYAEYVLLRDLLDTAEATLRVISLGRSSSALAGRVADKLKEFRTNEKPPGKSGSSRKEVYQNPC